MARIWVEFECGHSGRMSTPFGGAKGRQAAHDFAASRLCTACYRERTDEARAVEAAQAVNENRSRGLPPLEGEAGFQRENAEILRDHLWEEICGWKEGADDLKRAAADALLGEEKVRVWTRLALSRRDEPTASWLTLWMRIFGAGPVGRQLSLERARSNALERGLPSLVGIGGACEDAELFRDVIHDEANDWIDALDPSTRIAGMLLLEEQDAHTLVRLKARVNSGERLISAWKAVIEGRRKQSVSESDELELDPRKLKVIRTDEPSDQPLRMVVIHKVTVLTRSPKGAFKLCIERARMPALEGWVSAKKMACLDKCFKEIGGRYSRKGRIVLGVFDHERFVWAGVISGSRNDSGWLKRTFGVTGSEDLKETATNSAIVRLAVPENVEILPELIDED